MLINQHIYGKTREKDFSTLAVSVEMPREELKILEKHSHYQLPSSLLYQSDARKPKKYVYYRLNSKDIVIGRGVDIGRDEFGRVGNFLFHNMIISIEEIEKHKQNPLRVIQYLEEKGIFKDKEFLEDQIGKLDLDISNNLMSKMFLLSQNDKNLLPLLLYVCFKHQKGLPIYIIGSENNILSFLERLFNMLPMRLWVNLSFNTFWYQDIESFFCGIGIKEEEQRLSGYSLKINLENDTYESRINIQDNATYEYATFIANTALGDKAEDPILYSLYSLEDSVMTNNWDRFILLYKEASENIKNMIYDYHKNSVLNELLHGNIQLFGVLKEYISNDDLSKVFKSKGFAENLIRHRDEILTRDFISWFCGLPSNEARKDLYSLFLDNLWSLDLLLLRITDEKMKTNRNIEVILELIEDLGKKATEKKGYNEVTEERLLEGLYEILNNEPNVNMSPTLKIIKKLPASKNPKILLLRALIKYQIGDSSDFISLIKDESYKFLIQDIVKDSLKNINWEKYKKSFQEIESKSFRSRWIS